MHFQTFFSDTTVEHVYRGGLFYWRRKPKYISVFVLLAEEAEVYLSVCFIGGGSRSISQCLFGLLLYIDDNQN
jgi:hypothetical protein